MALSSKCLNEYWDAHVVNVECRNQHMIHFGKTVVVIWFGQTIRLPLGELMCDDGQSGKRRAQYFNVEVDWPAKIEGKSLVSFFR